MGATVDRNLDDLTPILELPVCDVCRRAVNAGEAWREDLSAVHRDCLPPPAEEISSDEELAGNIYQLCGCGEIIYLKMIW